MGFEGNGLVDQHNDQSWDQHAEINAGAHFLRPVLFLPEPPAHKRYFPDQQGSDRLIESPRYNSHNGDDHNRFSAHRKNERVTPLDFYHIDGS
jgi:hypothetical protein